MSATVTLQSPEVQHALGRAALYQLLSLGFAYPDEACLAELRAFVVDVSEHEIVEQLDLAEPLRVLAFALEVSDPTDLAGEHNRLFAGEVLCSAHETEYAFDPFMKSRQLADIAGFYQAFGLKVAQDRRGLPDFISTELEFLSLLLRKQIYAHAQGWTEQRELTEDAVRSFLEDHLGRWAPVFWADVRRAASDDAGFYVAIAEICERFVAGEVERAGVRPDRVRGRGIPLEDAEPFQCGLDATPTDGEVESEAE